MNGNVQDNRIAKLEEQITSLMVADATIVAAITHLSSTLTKLDVTVDELKDTMNKGRGALWVVVGASTLLGGAISAGVAKLLGH